MVHTPSHGACRALSQLHTSTIRYTPRHIVCSTRQLSTTRRPSDGRYLAIAQHHGPSNRRNYATTVGQTRPKNVAVLGGGLTGLSTAYYLTKFMPNAKVTVYEGSGRMGGWIDTETVEVTGSDGTKGTVRFERGARTVQPKTSLQNWDDLAFYELMSDLRSEVKDAALWKDYVQSDRFFYYPDHLVRLPRPSGGLSTIAALVGLAIDSFREPIYEGLLAFGFNILRGGDVRPDLKDISIGDEFLRRGGRREPVDNMLSAMCHGIYGGDVWKLSAESSIFGAAFLNQRLPMRGMSFWQRWKDRPVHLAWQDAELIAQTRGYGAVPLWLAENKVTKSINFGEGFSALTDGLIAKLKKNANVKFVPEKVAKVRLSATGRIEITTTKPASHPVQYDKVISSLYSKTLASLAPRNSLATLASSTAATIRLVNLWSPTPNLNHPSRGFGYLLPQSVPAEQNPHAALGVIFDSDRTPEQDVRGPHVPCAGDTVPGTKMTVMLGGHHWADLPEGWVPDAMVDDAAGIAAAKETVAIQLGIDPEEWQVARTKLCVDCIPQHLVGHTKRMEAADWELRTAFKGKLAVVGGSYTAPGVVGSVRAARDVAAQVAGRFLKKSKANGEDAGEKGVVGEGGEVKWTVGETGLARFVGGLARLWGLSPAKPLQNVRSFRVVRGGKQQ